MTVRLDAGSMDRWLSEFDSFRYDFLRHNSALAKAVGYSFDADTKALERVHADWGARCREWQTSRLQGAGHLSLIKIGSLLLYELASVEWLRELHEYTPVPKDDLIFAGAPDQRVEIRHDMAAGRGTYFAFQFVIGVLNWFEAARIDRHSEFEFRMTPDLEHDLMVYLLSKKHEEMGIFLALKALYVRDAKGGAAEAS